MDIDQAATFLAGSILISLGIVIVIIALVTINNIISRYWRPINWIHDMPGMGPQRFATADEIKELDKSVTPPLDKGTK
jgi:hypothetical protein